MRIGLLVARMTKDEERLQTRATVWFLMHTHRSSHTADHLYLGGIANPT